MVHFKEFQVSSVIVGKSGGGCFCTCSPLTSYTLGWINLAMQIFSNWTYRNYDHALSLVLGMYVHYHNYSFMCVPG